MLENDLLPQQELWQAQIAERELLLELAHRKTLYFCELTKPDWETGPHHPLLCDIMDKIIEDTPRRIAERRFVFYAISLPPRHTKSEIFSVRGPAHYLGEFPHHQLLHLSYASSLSNSFSGQVRSIIDKDETFHELYPDLALHPDRQRLDDWKTIQGGGFKSAGVGGGISGHGANGVIIDDPQKEGDEFSPTTMEQIFIWYASAVRTRLAPGAFVLIVMTRWSPEDLVGRVLQAAKENPLADQWQTVVLPALALKNDPLGRAPGDALWPERYTRENHLAVQSLSPRYFEALFQQDPQPEAAKLFFEKDFLRGLYESFSSPAVWTWDLAISEDEQADFTAGGRWHYDRVKQTAYVSEIVHMREEWPKVKDAIVSLMEKWPQDRFAFPTQVYELMAIKELRAIEGGKYAPRIAEVALKGDKRARAAVYSDVVSTGRAVVEPGAAGDAFIKEHDAFQGKNDDFVDMSSVAAHHFGFAGGFKAVLSGAPEKKPIDPALEALITR